MKNERTTWTKQQLRTLKTRFRDGLTDEMIGLELGRTPNAIQQKRVENNLMRKRGSQHKLVQGKYTRKTTSVKEISLLWGLIKYTKA